MKQNFPTMMKRSLMAISAVVAMGIMTASLSAYSRTTATMQRI